MRNRRAKQSAIIVLTAFLTACSLPYQTAKLNPKDASFKGIAALTSESPDKTLDVLIVHGMCTHDREWAVEAITGLHDALRAEEIVSPSEKQVPGTDVRLYQQTFHIPTGTVRVNAVVWSALTAGLKSQLCYDQSKQSAMCSKFAPGTKPYANSRALLNRMFKDTLLDDCLADAMIYQGKAREAISAQLQEAIFEALASTGGRAASRALAAEKAHLVIITESLGSKVTFDAILAIKESGDKSRSEAVTTAFGRAVEIFMEANQLPILALADQPLPEKGEVRAARISEDSLDILSRAREAEREAASKANRVATNAQGPLVVVAFSDPNDVLSYPLVDEQRPKAYKAIDVTVSNGFTHFWLFENPARAHQSYGETTAVRELIACGTSGEVCRQARGARGQ